jgi:hypothetical protein
MSVQEIKEAVRHLSLEERAEVAACLHVWEPGKLDKLLARVDADIVENKTLDMP